MECASAGRACGLLALCLSRLACAPEPAASRRVKSGGKPPQSIIFADGRSEALSVGEAV